MTDGVEDCDLESSVGEEHAPADKKNLSRPFNKDRTGSRMTGRGSGVGLVHKALFGTILVVSFK
jgi:hypothetical protein